MKSINWTLVIALGGLILGIYNTFVKPWMDKPTFFCSINNIITGEQTDENNKSVSMLFLALTLANEGNKLFSPQVFDCYIKNNNKWVQLDRKLIPKEAIFGSNKQEIKINEPYKKDLQRFSGGIEYGRPLNGYLMCTTNKLDVIAMRRTLLNAAKGVKLSCEDIYGKKHTFFPKIQLTEIEKETVYPKHGINIKPK